jgi:hypothetical protein
MDYTIPSIYFHIKNLFSNSFIQFTTGSRLGALFTETIRARAQIVVRHRIILTDGGFIH